MCLRRQFLEKTLEEEARPPVLLRVFVVSGLPEENCEQDVVDLMNEFEWQVAVIKDSKTVKGAMATFEVSAYSQPPRTVLYDMMGRQKSRVYIQEQQEPQRLGRQQQTTQVAQTMTWALSKHLPHQLLQINK